MRDVHLISFFIFIFIFLVATENLQYLSLSFGCYLTQLQAQSIVGNLLLLLQKEVKTERRQEKKAVEACISSSM